MWWYTRRHFRNYSVKFLNHLPLNIIIIELQIDNKGFFWSHHLPKRHPWKVHSHPCSEYLFCFLFLILPPFQVTFQKVEWVLPKNDELGKKAFVHWKKEYKQYWVGLKWTHFILEKPTVKGNKNLYKNLTVNKNNPFLHQHCLSFRFELLHVLNFDSVRRRMSVIVKSSSGKTYWHTEVQLVSLLLSVNTWAASDCSCRLFKMFFSVCVYLLDLRRIPALL